MMFYLKNMVSNTCKMVVKDIFEKFGVPVVSIDLGTIEVNGTIIPEQLRYLEDELKQFSFELLRDKRLILIEKIKTIIIDLVHHSDGEEELKVNFSTYLSERLNFDYTYLASLFSENEGITIEHFMICHKVERVKELIFNNELTLTEIAWKMNYSSLAHLSSQFKKVTGICPTEYKKSDYKKRIALEAI